MFTQKPLAPLNKFPLWKYLLIIAIIVLAIIYALPNLYGDSYAVQVSPKDGQAVTSSLVGQIKAALASDKLTYQRINVKEYNVQMTFSNTNVQAKAQEVLQAALGKEYIVAINLAPNAPAWLLDIGGEPMRLGLDLRGGMYFLLNVDTQSVLTNKLSNYAVELRQDLRQKDLRYAGITVNKSEQIVMRFRSQDVFGAAKKYVTKSFPGLVLSTDEGSLKLVGALSTEAKKEAEDFAVQQTIQVMRNRVNELGVAEASVARQGRNRVVIELPGVQDAAKAKAIIGGTSTLKVLLVNQKADVANAVAGDVPIGSSLYYKSANLGAGPVVLKNQVVLTGNAITGANATFDQQSGQAIVQVDLSGSQVNRFSDITGENVGNLMAIVLVEKTFSKKKINGKEITVTKTNQKVINIATIMSRLPNRFQIQGLQSIRYAQMLALSIRAGALPAPVQIAQDKQIGPSLGAQNIRMGAISVVVAMALVVLFMAIYYRLFGLIADLALFLNLVFIIAVMALLPGATLTLPGIAGIVLNMGMAIDANVLIFERIREELRNGSSPQAAIHAGFERAFGTILDSNVTTLIVAVILFAVGTGAVKGFAVTLMIGIITSMFTAITFTRGVVNLIYGGRQNARLSIGI